jgi:hypothetical protein
VPGDSGVTVVTIAGEHFYPFLPTRLRVHRAPGIPCALYLRGTNVSGKTSRETCGENAELCLQTMVFEIELPVARFLPSPSRGG